MDLKTKAMERETSRCNAQIRGHLEGFRVRHDAVVKGLRKGALGRSRRRGVDAAG